LLGDSDPLEAMAARVGGVVIVGERCIPAAQKLKFVRMPGALSRVTDDVPYKSRHD
jgi:hypothetical protein